MAAHLDSEIMVMDEVLAVGDMKFQQKCLGKMSDVAGHAQEFPRETSACHLALVNKATGAITFENFPLTEPGTQAANVTFSPVTGNAGTREFFLHVLLGKTGAAIPESAVYAAVDAARELERYRK